MINALRYAQILEEGGFTKEQANTNMKVIMSVVELVERGSATKQDIQLAQLATQADIQILRSDMKEMESSIRSDMKEMESSIRSDMKRIETSLRSDIQKLDTKIDTIMDKMIIRFTAALVVFSGIIIAAQKLL